MAMIPIETAAAQLSLPVETLETWAKTGLLTTEVHVPPNPLRLVDEQQLHDVVESLGWLHLSGETWDGPEEA